MRPYRKTYGVKGLIEWLVTFRTGSSTVRLHFTGGTRTRFGATPAVLTTANPVLQRLIEDSEYFKNGTIIPVSGTGTW